MTFTTRAALAVLASLSTATACTRHVPAQIEGYRPQAIAPQASAPVYFALGDALYFSRDGGLSTGRNPIWRGPRRGLWVAPDSAHVVVLSGESLKLLDQEGRELRSLSPANTIFSERPAGQDTYWDATSIQWSADGGAVFLFRRSGNAVGPVALCRYGLGEREPRELTRIDHPPRHFVPSDGYFLSEAADAVYYNLSERDDDFAWYRYDLASASVTTVQDVKGGVRRTDTPLPAPAHSFVNFGREALAGRNDAGVGWSWVRGQDLGGWLLLARWLDPRQDDCTLFSYRDDRLKPLLRTRTSVGGYSSSRDCGIRLDQSYYLPGGRQALVEVDTAQHKGLLLVDTQDGRYGVAPEGLEVFFPVNARNAQGLGLGPSGPRLETGLDLDGLLPRLRSWPSGER